MKRSTASALALVFGLGLALAAGPLWAADPTPAPSAAPVAAAPAPEASQIITPQMSEKVKAAIQKSLADPATARKTQEVIKPGAEPGYLGIPGAPQTSYILGFIWAVWVGWIFSTVGAFGGVMAGVGHITIFGLGDYAKGFGKDNPVNKMVTDSIRVSNQWLVGLSALISSINYYKMGRLVLPLAVCLAIGSMAGSYLAPALTAGKVNLPSYIGWCGACVLRLGCILLYETTPKGQASKKAAKEAASEFERQCKIGDTSALGVKITKGSYGGMIISLCVVLAGGLWGNLFENGAGGSHTVAIVLSLAGVILGLVLTAKNRVHFTFCGVEFSFPGYAPIIGGLLIAALAAFLGVGGGFLFVPFLTSVAGLPMFIVAGTSALAVLVGMIVSIFSYMFGKGVVVQWGFIGVELIGIFVGSMIGPRTSKYIPDKWLKIIFVVLAFYVGLRYFVKGFWGFSILPPY